MVFLLSPYFKEKIPASDLHSHSFSEEKVTVIALPKRLWQKYLSHKLLAKHLFGYRTINFVETLSAWCQDKAEAASSSEVPPHCLRQRLALGATAPSFWLWVLSLHPFPPLLENLVTNVFPGENVVYLLLRSQITVLRVERKRVNSELSETTEPPVGL